MLAQRVEERRREIPARKLKQAWQPLISEYDAGPREAAERETDP